jgi:hypothetical protein
MGSFSLDPKEKLPEPKILKRLRPEVPWKMNFCPVDIYISIAIYLAI